MFSTADMTGVVPYEDNPIILSVVLMGRNVHQELINQESSVDVMFWDKFSGLQIPKEQLQSFNGVLVGFSGKRVKDRGYVDLRTTFIDGTLTSTIIIKYMVVKSPSSST